jgi:hypothetical protein
MAVRIVKSSIAIDAPFRLKGRDETLPAGSYDVDTEEEIIEGNERTVYKRVATVLYVRSNGMLRAVTVDPKDLETIRSTGLAVAIGTSDLADRNSSKIDTTKPSPDESYHLNREPHERMLAAETTDPQIRAAHLKLAKMHDKMAKEARAKGAPLSSDA